VAAGPPTTATVASVSAGNRATPPFLGVPPPTPLGPDICPSKGHYDGGNGGHLLGDVLLSQVVLRHGECRPEPGPRAAVRVRESLGGLRHEWIATSCCKAVLSDVETEAVTTSLRYFDSYVALLAAGARSFLQFVARFV
jgi:hypothetical protein